MQIRKAWRWGVWLIVANEVRGLVVVGMTWPVWWPVITEVFRHAGLSHG